MKISINKAGLTVFGKPGHNRNLFKSTVLELRYSKMFSQGKRNDIIAELKLLENPQYIEEKSTYGTEFHKSKSRKIIGAEYDLKGCSVANYIRVD